LATASGYLTRRKDEFQYDQTATAMFALPVSVFIRIHRRFCAG
jgi:hypothetical protein